MARPKKLSTEKMVQIVNSYFENNSDPNRLKCSLLEEYAVSLGIEVKAYDFRRNAVVRERMNELKNSENQEGIMAIAYKSIDADLFINRNYTRDMMKNSLLELDETWQRIYKKANDLSQKNIALLSELSSQKRIVQELSDKHKSIESEMQSHKSNSNILSAENKYLKKMLKKYLYPAIANEILMEENVLEQVDTEVTLEAMEVLVDPKIPSSLSNIVDLDQKRISREEELLKRMSELVQDNNEV